MTNNQNQPREFDAVLGGEAPPTTDAVLGGVKGVKKRLGSPYAEIRLAALQDALNYQTEGLNLVIHSLHDCSRKVRQAAYNLLHDRIEPQVKQVLREYKYWDLFERINEPLNEGYIYNTFKKFYNRQVEIYDPKIGLQNTAKKAYVLDDDVTTFLREPEVNKVEALIFRGYYDLWRILSPEILKNIKALFYGPYDIDYQISWTATQDISLILKVFPNLEMLLVRGGDDCRAYSEPWEKFISLRHERLKVLIVETGGLSRDKIAQFFSLELPALEHLELWLGTDEYGGNSSIDDLMPIFSGNLFPKLTYLGLRNSEYANNIAASIVNSSVINTIKILDLSLGDLGDEGAEALLNCPAVNQLDILNISNSCLTEEMVERLKLLDVEVIADTEKEPGDRYCSVSE
ncbi:MAG: HEAT repeat domain-containing protein [Nostoc sp. NOS(2021)]|uniref:HEAT repeat domain-containing protein n=1 Tax=Nostoc sp. NOS(2021) TaxID=2815407 RepID=UPI0025F32920|nr:HEAT repeat domain-containing protein [Nostoc sp. NOS(2021)]MBN3898226.1 HEAT repeat domain-containing protein [Nostoc sp. NOS(2021)]